MVCPDNNWCAAVVSDARLTAEARSLTVQMAYCMEECGLSDLTPELVAEKRGLELEFVRQWWDDAMSSRWLHILTLGGSGLSPSSTAEVR